MCTHREEHHACKVRVEGQPFMLSLQGRMGNPRGRPSTGLAVPYVPTGNPKGLQEEVGRQLEEDPLQAEGAPRAHR